MIAVGFPWQHDSIPTKFMLDFVRSDLIGDSVILRGDCGDTTQSRNKIVKNALDIGVEYILFLDVDQGIPTDVRKRMDSNPNDIVTGITPHGNGEHLLIYKRNKDGSYTPLDMPSEPIEIDGAGLGCMKVSMKVFEKIKPPWFTTVKDEYGILKRGNDFVFCEKAQEAGFKIFADPSILTTHHKMESIS